MNANVTEPCAPPLHTPVTIGRSRMPGMLRAGSKTEARREVAFDLLVDPATDPAGHCEPRRPTARCCARCRARAGAETEGRGERAGHESSQHAAVVQQTKPRKVPRARTVQPQRDGAALQKLDRRARPARAGWTRSSSSGGTQTRSAGVRGQTAGGAVRRSSTATRSTRDLGSRRQGAGEA